MFELGSPLYVLCLQSINIVSDVSNEVHAIRLRVAAVIGSGRLGIVHVT